jgi:hypothetical protein
MGAVGAHKLVVLPGLTRPPDGLPTFLTTIVFEILHPSSPSAVTTKLNVPSAKPLGFCNTPLDVIENNGLPVTDQAKSDVLLPPAGLDPLIPLKS